MFEQLLNSITYLPPLDGMGIFYYLSQFFLFYIVFKTVHLIVILTINKKLAFKSNPFVSLAEHEDKILILGDSTAVGTGASRPEDTIGGMLGSDFPHTQIINVGVNGSAISDLPRQIDSVSDQKFNLIIISSGGNDTWKVSSMKSVRSCLFYTITRANLLSDQRVIFLINNNVGFGPFPSFISFFLSRRARKINEEIIFAAGAQQTPVIDLFSSERDNPFRKDPATLLASDGIHPSSEGYKVWYRRMWREMVARGHHYHETKNHL